MDKIGIHFELRFATLILGTTLTVISAWYFTQDNPSIDNVMAIMQVGITFFALIYTAMSINASAKVNNDAVLMRKKEKAFDFLDAYHELDKQGITRRSRLARNAIKGKSAQEIINILNGMEEERSALQATLNFFEMLAIAVHHEVVDESIIYSAFEPIVLDHRSTMFEYIQKYRLDKKSPKYMKNFTDLAEDWLSRQ